MNIKIKRKKIDTKPEEDLLIGMIMSSQFISEIMPLLKTKYLKLPAAKTVSHWCIDYYKQYKEAPAAAIKDIFQSHIRNGLDEEQEEYIDTLLENLSERFEEESPEKFNTKFLTDQSEKYLAERKLDILKEDITALLSKGEIDKAESLVAKHTRTERHAGTSIDIMRDLEAVEQDMNFKLEVLLKLPGAIGQMIGSLCRADFFAVIAPMKRGKTWWLEELAIRAVLKALNVLFVTMEMPQYQMTQRFYQNFLGQPKVKKEIEIPYFDEDGDVSHKLIEKEGMHTKTVLKKAQALAKMIKGGGIRLLAYPSRGACVADIKTEIENLAHYENFYPDVIVVDYADILAAEPDSPKEYRHRLDHTWVCLRGLAQETNSLVITATQSTRGTFSKDVTEEDIAEDVRKLAHVTHMMSLNQTKEEKKKNIMRTSMLLSRNEEFQTDDEVVCLYQYGIGKAVIDSKWKKDVLI